jgi:hypothetical protein
MPRPSILQFIKLVHTLIWLFFNAVIGYMLYAVLTDQLDLRLWICYGLVVAEGLTLLFFGWKCPLTIMARKYSSSSKDNFDIFLPEWLAKYTKTIYIGLTVLILLITFYRLC